jgi:hypothetical protein
MDKDFHYYSGWVYNLQESIRIVNNLIVIYR